MLTISSVTQNVKGLEGVALSLPRLIGAKGVLAELKPNLSNDEEIALKKSADMLREAAKSIGY